MHSTALIGDFGATNARFALVRDGEVVEERVLRATTFPGPEEAIAAYLAEIGLETPPPVAALAVASPITGDRVSMTNLAWVFSVRETARRFGFRVLKVVNDFVAVALSVPHIAPAHRVPIGGGTPAEGEVVSVLGPGTGLGVSTLVNTGAGYVALPGEGGHVTLSAADDLEAKVIAYLRRHYDHVSAERVLSGMGLVNLYEAVATIAGEQPAQYGPAEVTSHADGGRDPHCRTALDLFFRFLGTVAGNAALTVGARGGVYLAGGILPRMVDHLQASDFRRRFEAKGRFAGYMSAIPTYLVTDPMPAMLGLRATAEMAAAALDG